MRKLLALATIVALGVWAWKRLAEAESENPCWEGIPESAEEDLQPQPCDNPVEEAPPSFVDAAVKPEPPAVNVEEAPPPADAVVNPESLAVNNLDKVPPWVPDAEAHPQSPAPDVFDIAPPPVAEIHPISPAIRNLLDSSPPPELDIRPRSLADGNIDEDALPEVDPESLFGEDVADEVAAWEEANLLLAQPSPEDAETADVTGPLDLDQLATSEGDLPPPAGPDADEELRRIRAELDDRLNDLTRRHKRDDEAAA